MATKKSANNLSAVMKELEQLVTKMEQKDLPLEKSLEHFEKGISLVATCQKTLKKTEQKVQQLIESSEQLSLEDFEPNNNE